MTPEQGRAWRPLVNIARSWVLICSALVPWSALANNNSAGHLEALKRLSFEEMRLAAGGADLNRGEWLEDATPRDIAGLRSLLTLETRVEFDAQLRYQTRIERQPMVVSGEGLDRYTELDLRLGWQANARWDLSLVGQNLLHDDHVEFGPPDRRGALERAAYLRATWRN